MLRMMDMAARLAAGGSGIARAGAEGCVSGSQRPPDALERPPDAPRAAGPGRPVTSGCVRTRRRRRPPHTVCAIALALVAMLTWVVTGPSGTAQAATACTAALCVLDSSAADALYVHPGSVAVTGSIL